MKHLRTLFVGLFAVLLVVGCGGGGGGSDGDDQPAVTYTGLLTQARITAENAMEFNAFILGDGIFPLPPMEELVAVPETQALVTSRESRPATSSTATALTCTPTTETGSFPGAISGHVDYSARISEDCSAVIEFSYVNFNDGDGSIYDGVLTVRVFDYDMSSEMFMSMALSTDALEFQGDAVHIVLSGTATLSLAGSDALTSVETMTMNFDGRDEVTRKTFRVQDLRSALSCNTSTFPPNYCSEQVSGRIYLEDDGYVEISVDTPLVYNYASRFNVDVPDAGGPVILHGAGNTREVITPLSIVQVNIGLDTNGDGSFEESTTLDWRDLVGLVFTFEALQGTVNFDVANDGTETADGGFAAVGWTNAMGEDQLDGYLVKVNAAGELEWAAQYGGAGDQSLQSVVQARDGGFVMIGSSISTSLPPVEQIYVVKTDALGVEQWTRTWTGENGDIGSRGYAIHENADGSLMIAGNMYSWGPFSGVVGLGFEDVYLAKLDPAGALVWEKRLGGGDNDYAYAMAQVADGGYVLTGTSSSLDYGSLHEDLYLIKVDADGNLLWERHFGGAGDGLSASSQFGQDVVEDASGQLVVVGSTTTYSYGDAVYLLKLTADGALIWDQVFAGTVSLPLLRSIDLTADGNYILTGDDGFYVHLVQLDPNGTLLWDKTFNWSNYLVMSSANAVQATRDGGYAVFGSAWPPEGKSFYLLKTNSDGELWQWLW